jgi:hypothetical protein
MQYQPVTKLSSFGKGLDSDLANARYISRFGTLTDEMGNHIPQKNRAEAVEERLKQVQNENKTSFRVIVSLPAENTDKARQIIEDEIRNRYSSFLVAFHAENDKGEKQPHLHCLIFNDQKKHLLKDRNEIFSFRDSIGERFKKNNISFPLSDNNLKPKLKQSEIHMRERGQKLWLDDIRNAVSHALSASADFDSFQSLLAEKGITISRETPNSLTFQDSQNRKARLDRLFTRMKNRADIENQIAKNQGNADRLRRAEQMFCNRLVKTAEAMKFQNIRKEEIQQVVNSILAHRANTDTVSDRWEALKSMKTELDKIMTKEQLKTAKQQMYQQQRIRRHQGRMMKKALRAGNPITAFVASIAYILNVIATRHGDLNRDGVTEDKQDKQTELAKMREKEIIESFRGTLNPPDMLKKQTPEPNRMTPGR